LDQCFRIYAEGLKTGFDDALVSFTEREARDKLDYLGDLTHPTSEIRKRYGVGDKGWANELLADRPRTRGLAIEAMNDVTRFSYRPLDFRFCAMQSKLVKAPSRVAGRNMRDADSVCLLAARQVAGPDHFSHIFVSRTIPDNRFFYSKKGSVTYFPLYAGRSGTLSAHDSSCVSERARERFSESLGLVWSEGRTEATEGTISAHQLLSYAYAVFTSAQYRSIFDAQLKREFPRIPLTKNLLLFRVLAQLGGELVGLHLLETPKVGEPLITYSGPAKPSVEVISYDRRTAWLDRDQTRGFRGVDEDIWNFQIGGYQVCAKWLKDRKGRVLSAKDIEHYQRIVVALSETIRIMGEIDEVIEENGGWPGAFQTAGGGGDA
jgi:hypothetical protein